MKPSRAPCLWLTLLLLVGSAAVQAQEEKPAEPGLTPPPLVPVPAPGEAPQPGADEPEPSGARPGPEEAPPSEPPGQEPKPSVSTEALPRKEAAAPPEDPVPRVALEVVGGAAGGLVGGSVGAAAGFLLSTPTMGCTSECRVTVLAGGFAGVALGIPAGAWLSGRLMGGQGRFLATVAGSAVGWGGALLGTLLLGSDNETLSLVLLALPVAGASAGYELSHSARRGAASQEPTVRVMPVAGFGERGPRLGLLGRF